MANSFPMFARCSLAQWRGYKPQVRESMTIGPDLGLFELAMGAEYRNGGIYPLWVVGGLPMHQGVLIKVIEE
jgi:hypothetical protein